MMWKVARWAPVVTAVVLVALCLVVWRSRPAAASTAEAPPPMRALAARPEGEGGPTLVHVGAYVINLTTLDEQTQTFTGDFYLAFSWLDRRLADPSVQHMRAAALEQVWHPRLLPANRRTTEFAYPQIVEIDPTGVVRYTQRMAGTFTVPLELRDFPRDHQSLYVEIVSPGYSPGEVTFVVDEGRVGRQPDLALQGWRLGAPTIRPFTKVIAFAAHQGFAQLSGIRVEMEATRNWQYYALREVLPLLFIVLMSSSLFWIPPTEHNMKLGISTGAIFSLMAFYVQLGRFLPKVDYLTKMDWFIVGSTILVFLSFAQVIVGMYLVKSDRTATVRRVERWSRAVYPLAVLANTAVAFS